MRGDWPRAIVGVLAQCKARGVPFSAAWRQATSLHPASTAGSPVTLFDPDGEPHDTQAGFLRRVCRDAYEDRVGPAGSGNGPELRSFRPELLEGLDLTEAGGGFAQGTAKRRRAA
jgi:hypothetical protein